MALHWNIEKVSDYQELTEEAQERIITKGCCWASLVYGIGRITADTIDEWIFRQEFVLLTENWAPIAKWPEGVEPKDGPIPPMRLSRAQYERRIGFETNVTTCLRKRWLQLRVQKLVEDVETNLRRSGL